METINEQATSSTSVENFDFGQAVTKAAERQVKGNTNTKQRFMLNRSKLIGAVCNEFRSTYPTLFAKRDATGKIIASENRLSQEYYDKVAENVDTFINKQFARINASNVTGIVVRHVWAGSKQAYVERIVNTGENAISLDEQLLAVHIDQGRVKRSIEDNDKKNRLTDELLAKLNTQMAKLVEREQHIKAEMGKQQQLLK